MDTKITQVSPVEYELEITATAEELAPAFTKALKAQRTRTTMKGFRAGKVPLQLVKKMYGEAIAYSLADKSVQETYEQEVLAAGTFDILGQPTITELDYEMDGNLRAVIKFGVRPTIELKDLADEPLTTLVHEVTDEEVEEALERFLLDQADLMPVEDEPATEKDFVEFNLQELDPASGTPIIGKRDEEQSLFLDDERLDDTPMLQALRNALIGARAGDTVRFHFEHDEAHGEHDAGHIHHFMAEVVEVKRRDLPELDEELVEEVTGGRIESVEEFRTDFRRQLERMWERRVQELLESEITERMLELHPIPVPDTVVEFFLDSFVEDVKRRNDGEWPEHVDEQAFRQANREEAERQARWMLLRDKVVADEDLSVTEEEFDAFFEEQAESDGRLPAEQLRQFYQSMPQLMEQVENRLLNQKLFSLLASRFQRVEKDWDTYKDELEAKETSS